MADETAADPHPPPTAVQQHNVLLPSYDDCIGAANDDAMADKWKQPTCDALDGLLNDDADDHAESVALLDATQPETLQIDDDDATALAAPVTQLSAALEHDVAADNGCQPPNKHANGTGNGATTAAATTEPTALSKFEPQAENADERQKRARIERALADPAATLATWRAFATSEYGLINDDLRAQVWPRLLGIDPHHHRDGPPSLETLRHHPEYNQVILDVNRSLKRFPPGIPYEQRIALQDQLTVLILRVILKHPHLRYYQGYHDVAVTFLLVVGDEMAFHVMEHLSTNHLVECMQETMEPTQRRLMFMYPLVRHERPALCAFVQRSGVGTLFALPWFLTWFGHSLNSYRDVVRLYDYFLARPCLLPIYVTAAIVLYREDDIYKEDCDMASLHCVLSRLPDDLPFEYIMRHADELYERWPPAVVEVEVAEMVVEEKVSVCVLLLLLHYLILCPCNPRIRIRPSASATKRRPCCDASSSPSAERPPSVGRPTPAANRYSVASYRMRC